VNSRVAVAGSNRAALVKTRVTLAMAFWVTSTSCAASGVSSY
jgi:hypothetical protein